MEKKNSIVKDIAIGVAVGAAVTMLRKENRDKFASNARRARTKMIEIREHAAPLKDRVKEGVQNVGTKGREMADLKVVKEKVDEIRKLTPAVVETLKETRDIFNKKKQELKESSVPTAQAESRDSDSHSQEQADNSEQISESEVSLEMISNDDEAVHEPISAEKEDK
jgi:hypothetical protein